MKTRQRSRQASPYSQLYSTGHPAWPLPRQEETHQRQRLQTLRLDNLPNCHQSKQRDDPPNPELDHQHPRKTFQIPVSQLTQICRCEIPTLFSLLTSFSWKALPTLFTWDTQRGRDEEMSWRKRVRRQMEGCSFQRCRRVRTISHF